jgi:hypothetical protein
VESASGAIALRRLRAEAGTESREAREEAERRAQRGIAVSLVVLGLWIAAQSSWTLWRGERPQVTWIGIGLPLLSIGVMAWLARAKLQVAGALRSRALEADAFQTTTCFRLSVLTLAGNRPPRRGGPLVGGPRGGHGHDRARPPGSARDLERRPCGCASC